MDKRPHQHRAGLAEAHPAPTESSAARKVAIVIARRENQKDAVLGVEGPSERLTDEPLAGSAMASAVLEVEVVLAKWRLGVQRMRAVRMRRNSLRENI